MSQRGEPVVGWLATGHGPEQWWPGVLMHPGAFLVRAPAELLHDPAGDLTVSLGTAERAVGEIRIIDGPARQAPSPHSTAMIRLLMGEPDAGSVTLDRIAVTAGWVNGETTWSLLRQMGILPVRWPDPPAVRRPSGLEPGPIAVKTVQAAPADWCTIFWWLC
jgi:hypothetical protein